MLVKQQTGNIVIWLLSIIAVAAVAAVAYWYVYPQQKPWWVKEYLPAVTGNAAQNSNV